MKLPIQEIWLHEQEDGAWDVIDGQQRLTSIAAFAKGNLPDNSIFKLKGTVLHNLVTLTLAINFMAILTGLNELTPDMQDLNVLNTLNGKTYHDLQAESPALIEAFESFDICLRIVKKEAQPDGVFEIYQRINTGAENLNSQQIRRAAYRHDTIICWCHHTDQALLKLSTCYPT